MNYKYKKKKKADKGAAVGDPKEPTKKPLTKESNFKDTKVRFAKEFPNASIPDSVLQNYAMVYLLSGRREDAMQKMIEKERKRQKDESRS